MSYSDFTLPDILKVFELKYYETPDLFKEVEPLAASNFLKDSLEDNLILAWRGDTNT